MTVYTRISRNAISDPDGALLVNLYLSINLKICSVFLKISYLIKTNFILTQFLCIEF